MGSFNVACTGSNLSIHCGDEVVFIPLISNILSDDKNVGQIPVCSYLVSNEGACHFYCPAFLPIHGIYDDYGTICNIIEDNNTKIIEEYFGISISRFVDIVSCGEGAYDAVYDQKFLKNKLGKYLSFEHRNISYDFFRDCGFKKIKGEKIWIHPKVEGFSVQTLTIPKSQYGSRKTGYRILKGERNLCNKNRGYYADTTHFIEDWLSLTKYHLLYGDEKATLIAQLSSISGMFVLKEIYNCISEMRTGEYFSQRFGQPKMIEALKESENIDLETLKFEAEFASLGDISNWSDDDKKLVNQFFLRNDMSWDEFRKTSVIGNGRSLFDSLRIYKGKIDDSFTDQYDRLNSFVVGLYHVNRILMPIQNGCQFGDSEATLILAQKNMEISARRLRKQLRYGKNDDLQKKINLLVKKAMNV